MRQLHSFQIECPHCSTEPLQGITNQTAHLTALTFIHFIMLALHTARKLISRLDHSVNWVYKHGKGHLETRFVQKRPDYIIAYVSSHSGCRMGCKFCHLTAQGQTAFDHVTVDEYVQQVNLVLNYHHLNGPWFRPAPTRVNVNWMAMGEPLANKHLLSGYSELYLKLELLARNYNLKLKPNISTIMPLVTRDVPLAHVFRGRPVNLYYSLYSVDDEFRKRWLPLAQPWWEALARLEQFQSSMGWTDDSAIKFHWCFIKGHNDSLDQVRRTAEQIARIDLSGTSFNLVRFNPPAGSGLEEPDEEHLQRCFEVINQVMDRPEKSYIVPRVGLDVKASCGMFTQ